MEGAEKERLGVEVKALQGLKQDKAQALEDRLAGPMRWWVIRMPDSCMYCMNDL